MRQQPEVYHYYAVGEPEGNDRVRYAPHGGIGRLRLGNGLWEQRSYNARLEPTQIGLGTARTTGRLTPTGSGLLLLDYSYGETGAASNNGNLQRQRIRATGLDQTQVYTYDSLNRLNKATETGSGTDWSQSYAYDRFGGPSWPGMGVTVRSGRGAHTPSGGGAANRTDGSPVIAGTSNLVRVQAITA